MFIRVDQVARRKPPKPELPPDVVPDTVDNPYTHDGAQRRITVLCSTRDDPLRRMLLKDRTIDEAQYQAGRLWQRYREQAEIGALRAIDTTKEPVDGGGSFPEPITDAHKRAVTRLNEARAILVAWEVNLLTSVLDNRVTLTSIAAAHGFVSNRGRDFISRRFRGCLEKLAKLWGLAG
jgi:transposase InsO family protein